MNSYSVFARTWQTKSGAEFNLGSFATAAEKRVVKVFFEIRDEHVRVDGVVHSTAVNSLVEETVNKFPLDFASILKVGCFFFLSK